MHTQVKIEVSTLDIATHAYTGKIEVSTLDIATPNTQVKYG